MASTISLNGRVAIGYKATFGVTTDVPLPFKYQWKKNGLPIPGAPSASSYTTPELRQQDMGNRYSVIITGRTGVEEEAPEIKFFKEPQ